MAYDFEVIGEYLKKRRLKKKLSQADVARALGYASAQIVSNWERGLCSPPLDQLATIVKIYGLTQKQMIDIFIKGQKVKLERLLKGAGNG